MLTGQPHQSVYPSILAFFAVTCGCGGGGAAAEKVSKMSQLAMQE